MQSFYFYDLETSGTKPKSARIMQFAGQRTNMNLEPIGEPDNILVKLSEDVLPEPDAVMVTGITPQMTLADGIGEPEFLKYFSSNVCTSGTIFVGFNNIRFDDEFLRYTLYRNFYDPYEWSWADGRSRWDLLDVTRMTRALRQDGIEWPFAPDGKPSNRLELLTAVNNLKHDNAHDALGDVKALIAVAQLIKQKQPKLFDYLLTMRDKKKVRQLVNSGQPFVYTSGKYSSKIANTTVVVCIDEKPDLSGALVYDLRRDPDFLSGLSAEQIAEAWLSFEPDESKRFPIKSLQYNRCPAVAPYEVLNDANLEGLSLKPELIKANLKKLLSQSDLKLKLTQALEIMDKRRQTSFFSAQQVVDEQLYDDLPNEADKSATAAVREAGKEEIEALSPTFADDRLNKLLPLYKARNYKSKLNDQELTEWETFRKHKLLDGNQSSLASKYFQRLSELALLHKNNQAKLYLLEELQLYGQSIIPYED